jgi:hypothetical protein
MTAARLVRATLGVAALIARLMEAAKVAAVTAARSDGPIGVPGSTT